MKPDTQTPQGLTDAEADELLKSNDRSSRSDARWLLQQAAAIGASKITSPNRDPVIELRSLLKEMLDVLQCHHRNTHKPLIERVRNYRSML